MDRGVSTGGRGHRRPPEHPGQRSRSSGAGGGAGRPCVRHGRPGGQAGGRQRRTEARRPRTRGRTSGAFQRPSAARAEDARARKPGQRPAGGGDGPAGPLCRGRVVRRPLQPRHRTAGRHLRPGAGPDEPAGARWRHRVGRWEGRDGRGGPPARPARAHAPWAQWPSATRPPQGWSRRGRWSRRPGGRARGPTSGGHARGMAPDADGAWRPVGGGTVSPRGGRACAASARGTVPC